MRPTVSDDEVYEYGYRHGRQLSHFLVDVTAHGRDNLARALGIAFTDIVDGMEVATHHRLDGARQLTFFHRPPRRGDAIARALDLDGAVALAWDWLSGLRYADGDHHDGAQRPGFRVYNGQFGIVDEDWDAFVAVRPMWIYLPK